jgi:5-methylcytosine-specific restriction protein A
MENNKDRYGGKLIHKSKLPINKSGFVACRWCGGDVKPPRRTMCSPECVHELLIRRDNRYIRDCLYKRDNGICSICNIDTKEIAKKALSLHGDDKVKYLTEMKIGIKRKIWKRKHGGGLWDADHIVPVKDGGGQCGMDNLRTLCIKCHKNVTKDSYK